jgi:multisubunit Na+/H+ antiporter MnhE subunit
MNIDPASFVVGFLVGAIVMMFVAAYLLDRNTRW